MAARDINSTVERLDLRGQDVGEDERLLWLTAALGARTSPLVELDLRLSTTALSPLSE